MSTKEKVVGILTEKWVWISSAVIIGLFFIWRIAKGRQTKDEPTVADYDPATVEYLDDADKGKAEALADALYKDLKGINVAIFTGHNLDLHRQYLESAENIFKGVYSIFNQKYQSEYNQTLKQWYEKETGINLLFGGVLDWNWYNVRKSIISRMNQSQLT